MKIAIRSCILAVTAFFKMFAHGVSLEIDSISDRKKRRSSVLRPFAIDMFLALC